MTFFLVYISYISWLLSGKAVPPPASPPEKPYHEFCVTFRQHICDKVDFFQLFYNLVQKSWLGQGQHRRRNYFTNYKGILPIYQTMAHISKRHDYMCYCTVNQTQRGKKDNNNTKEKAKRIVVVQHKKKTPLKSPYQIAFLASDKTSFLV